MEEGGEEIQQKRRPSEEEEEQEEGPKSQPQQPQQQQGGGGGWRGWGISSLSVFSDLQKAAEEISRNVFPSLLSPSPSRLPPPTFFNARSHLRPRSGG